jgi:hypothetical protein
MFYGGWVVNAFVGDKSGLGRSDAGNSLTELTPVIKAMVPTPRWPENGPEVALPKQLKMR